MDPESFDPYEGIEPFDPGKGGGLSVTGAVLAGHGIVSGGVVAIVVATMVVGSAVTSLPWVALAAIGSALGWPYWSAMVPRWWRWALARGLDPYDLQRAAEDAQLVWPRDSLLARTEFGDRWAGIDRPTTDRFAELRDQLLSGGSTPLLGRPVDGPLWGVVSEYGVDGDVATLIALDDGTCSLHTRSGGGVGRTGADEGVRGAVERLIEVATRVGSEIGPARDVSPVGPGEVGFYLLFADRVCGVRGPSATLLVAGSAASALHGAAQELLAVVRRAGAG